MSALPLGWARAKLGDICDVVSGSTPKTGVAEYWGGDIAWLTPDDLSKDRRKVVGGGARTLTQAGYDSCSTRLVPPGSVLFSSRAPVGYVAIAGAPLCTNQGCKSAVPPIGLDPDYLYWYLRWRTPEIESRASGTTFREVSSRAFAETQLLLPPLAEQRRIVEALEDHLSRLDAADGHITTLLQRWERWRVSVLQSALLGRSSAGFESLGPLPMGKQWPSAPIADLADVGSGATPLRSRVDYYQDGTIPWVTSGLLNEDRVNAAREYITERALKESAVRMWPPGTLLVAMYGEGQTRGRCAELVIAASTNQACAGIRVRNEDVVRRRWLKLFFDASYEAHRGLASGGVQPNLSLRLIKGMRVPLPPVDHQDRVLASVERAVANGVRLRHQVQMSQRMSFGLRRSLMERAFSGRLASHEPSDELASELLDRIESEAAAVPSRKRRATAAETEVKS